MKKIILGACAVLFTLASCQQAKQKVFELASEQVNKQCPITVDEMTRMMHTLKSNAKAIGAMNLHELAKELEFRAKKEDLEYIRNGYPLLKFEWNRVLNTVKKFLEMTQDIVENNSKEEVCNGSKEQLKVLIMRYQAKEAKEQIKRLLEGQVTDEERKLLEKMEMATDELDFDEAEILFKRWEAME